MADLTTLLAKMPKTGPAWLQTARADAKARLEDMGLPARRDEYWRWTRADNLVSETPATSEPYDHKGEALVFDALDRVRITFVDGVFDPEQSDDLALEGLEISRLADAGDDHWVEDSFAQHERAAQSPVPRPLGVLNTALASDGVLIRAHKTVEKPVSIIYRTVKNDGDSQLRHVVQVEKGAEVTVLENGIASARLNSVMEVTVEDGGTFHHVRAQGRDHDRHMATHIFGSIGEDATFKSFTLSVNGALTRNESFLNIQGDNSVAHIAGAVVGDGTFHHDDTVFVIHDAQNCESRQVFKKVLMNGAKGIFQGKILVKPDAQKTDGYQISQSLLLDDESQFLAKPELEIYADDVACSHGSTTGAIDDDALYYLRSRGVPLVDAQDLLVMAFLAEALEEIERDDIREDLQSRLENWFKRRRV
ncbi:MAG: Fe-S cluster assembly protein SufD [Halocynthiibacter sp.]